MNKVAHSCPIKNSGKRLVVVASLNKVEDHKSFIIIFNGTATHIGGETGIRTLETFSGLLAFQASPIDHSGISPRVLLLQNITILLTKQPFSFCRF